MQKIARDLNEMLERIVGKVLIGVKVVGVLQVYIKSVYVDRH